MKIKDLTGQRFGRLMVIQLEPRRTAGGQARWACLCDCGSESVATGGNLRAGTTTSCGCAHRDKASLPRKALVSYTGAHERCRSRRGRAQEFACVTCGEGARHWSYNHDDPSELISPEGWPYSQSPEHYSPRCSPCHRQFDSQRRSEAP